MKVEWLLTVTSPTIVRLAPLKLVSTTQLWDPLPVSVKFPLTLSLPTNSNALPFDVLTLWVTRMLLTPVPRRDVTSIILGWFSAVNEKVTVPPLWLHSAWLSNLKT